MANVKKVQFRHASGAFYESVLKVNSAGIFYIDVPDEVANFAGEKRHEGKVLEDVILKWRIAIGEYLSSTVVERKVIFFKLKMTARIMNRDGSYYHARVNSHHFDGDSGVEVAIQADVFLERKTSGGGRENIEYFHQENSIPSSMRYIESLRFLRDGAENNGVLVLDWTPERERQIAKFAFQFETLLLNLIAFTEDRDTFQKMIDSGNQLFLEGGKDDNQVGTP